MVHLQVGMPALPIQQGKARTRARIGRSVAALFGIPGHPGDRDAGAGRAWRTSYSALTKEEIALGGPRGMTPKEHMPGVLDTGVFGPNSAKQGRDKVLPAGKQDQRRGLGEVGGPAISATLFRGFGPDQKAAVILTGANEVLRPLTSAMTRVLRQLDFPDPRLQIGTTAMLFSEAYRSQPLLMQAAMQAVGVQRSYLHECRTAVLSDGPTSPWQSSRTDIPYVQHKTQNARSSDGYPDRIDLVFEVWSTLMDPTSRRSLRPVPLYNRRVEPAMDTSQIGNVHAQALEAICTSTADIVFGRLGALGGTRIVLMQQPDGSFAVDFPGVATRPARLVADTVLGRYFSDTPYRDVTPGDMPVPVFDAQTCIAEPDSLTQRVMLWAFHCCERFVVSGAWSEMEPQARSFSARTEQRVLLARTCETIFGQSDPLTRQLWAYAASYRMERVQRSLREHGSVPAGELENMVDEFERRVEDLRAVHAAGRFRDSHLVETLHPILIDLREVVETTDDDRIQKQAQTILESNWLHYLRVQMRLLTTPERASRPPESVIRDLARPGAAADPILQQILESSPGIAMGVSGFDWTDALACAAAIQANIVERRQEIFTQEGDWPPLRQALVDQITLMILQLENARQGSAAEVSGTGGLLHSMETNVRALLVEEFRQRDLPEAPIAIIDRPLSGLDVIGVLLADYLVKIDDLASADRELGSLKHDITAGLRRFSALVRRQLSSTVWKEPALARHRDIIERALGGK